MARSLRRTAAALTDRTRACRHRRGRVAPAECHGQEAEDIATAQNTAAARSGRTRRADGGAAARGARVRPRPQALSRSRRRADGTGAVHSTLEADGLERTYHMRQLDIAAAADAASAKKARSATSTLDGLRAAAPALSAYSARRNRPSIFPSRTLARIACATRVTDGVRMQRWIAAPSLHRG